MRVNPCPICGSEVNIWYNIKEGVYHIECDCGLRTAKYKSFTQSLDAWNSGQMDYNRDLQGKIARIENLAEEASNHLYVDNDGIGSIEECRRLLNEIMKECEGERNNST